MGQTKGEIILTNPLNLPGSEFLQFYLVLVILTFLSTLLLRRCVKGWRRSTAIDKLNILEVAYLAGGPRRLADTVVVALLAADLIRYDESRRIICSGNPAAPLPPEFEPFRSTVGEPTTRRYFRSRTAGALVEISTSLVRYGLIPRPTVLRVYRIVSFALLSSVVLLGLAKLVIGGHRHHPIGILLCATLFVAAFSYLIWSNPPSRTSAGDDVFEDTGRRLSRIARAPREIEIPLGFAIAGAAMLVGTPYAAFGQSIHPTSNSSGNGCSGGGGCGGGGGGCGGGCGGCS